MINPASIAFDIDGVVADTMSLFLEIAESDYGIKGFNLEDITSYMVEDCLDINVDILEEIFERIIYGDFRQSLRPLNGAGDVLSSLSVKTDPLLFVTARPSVGPIHDWLAETISIEKKKIEVIATGSFDAKKDILLDRDVSFFVEDRLETGFVLDDAGIQPVIFSQPWNRLKHSFLEVNSWDELGKLILM